MTQIKKGINKFYLGDVEDKPKAEVKYIINEENKIIIEHTFVSPELGGQGVGKILIKEVVDFARQENKKIIPKCEYAKKEFTKNKEYGDVLFKYNLEAKFMNVLEFAINMELEGEKYYNKQAENTNVNTLKNIFLILAKDEKDHAKILQNKSNNLSYELNDSEILSKSKNLFKGIKDYKNEIKENPDQLDLYIVALEKEKESVTLYEKLLSETTDDKSKDLFKFLIKQEKDHYTTLEELVLQLNKCNDWVESAEFGIRSDD